jgi:hypothetical protein
MPRLIGTPPPIRPTRPQANNHIMFKLTYEGLNFSDQDLPEFVETVSRHAYGKKIVLNDSIATGNYKLLEFPNGFYAYASNYILHRDFELELSVSRPDYVALHINQILAGAECRISINGQSVAYDDKVITSIFLTAGNDKFLLSGSKGACVNRLKIMVPISWLQQQPAFRENNSFSSYFGLNEERLYFDALDTTYRTMVDKVMGAEDHDYYISVTENIVTMITERFFNRLSARLRKTRQAMR